MTRKSKQEARRIESQRRMDYRREMDQLWHHQIRADNLLREIRDEARARSVQSARQDITERVPFSDAIGHTTPDGFMVTLIECQADRPTEITLMAGRGDGMIEVMKP